MYKLLGSDQKEYGPVSVDQLRAWISQGRANGRSQLQAAGSTEWKPLAEFPEFADALKAMAGGAPPSLPGGQAQPAAPAKTSGMAITSLVLGCLGLFTCGITALVGLVLGIVALVRINKSKGQLGGQGLALAGTIVSALFLLMGVAFGAALLLPALARAKSKANSIYCMNNVKQLNLALWMYAGDNKDELPAGTNWCDVLKPYAGGNTNVFICPQGTPGARCHYALNAAVAGHSTKDIQSPAQTVLVFECDGGWNVSGGREFLPATPRHMAYTVGFADGHAEMVRAANLGKLHWEP